jgi:CarD family transcriptional regulator
MSLIEAMPDMESIWIDDDKQRNAAFKAALKSGKNEEWAKLIKTLHLQKEARTVDGKKLAKIDEDIMNRAEKFLNEEFSVALDISPDEVVPFIKKHIPLNNGNPNQKVIQEWHEMDKTLTK